MNRDGFLDPNASVVWDRRVEERRRSREAGVPDRRVTERRQLRVAEHLRRYGFAVVDRERHQVIPPPAARVSGLGYNLPAEPPPPT